MFDKTIFAKRLYSLRTRLGISQLQLSEHLEVSFHQVSKMENAQRACSVDTLVAIADYFDVSIDYLVGRSDDPARH